MFFHMMNTINKPINFVDSLIKTLQEDLSLSLCLFFLSICVYIYRHTCLYSSSFFLPWLLTRAIVRLQAGHASFFPDQHGICRWKNRNKLAEISSIWSKHEYHLCREEEQKSQSKEIAFDYLEVPLFIRISNIHWFLRNEYIIDAIWEDRSFFLIWSLMFDQLDLVKGREQNWQMLFQFDIFNLFKSFVFDFLLYPKLEYLINSLKSIILFISFRCHFCLSIIDFSKDKNPK